MSSILINTAPEQKSLYTVKKYEGNVFSLPFHKHDRFELTYIIKGKGTRIIGDNVQEYEDGDIVLIAPYTPHHWQSTWVKQKSVLAITVFFSTEFPTKDFRSIPEFNTVANLLEIAKYGIELKGNLRKNIATKIKNLSFEYSLSQMINILSILRDIAQSQEYNILMERGFSIPKKYDRERISDILSYIQNNISQKITTKDLAEIACMHHGSVNRFFKQGTGFSLVKYIILIRIGLACEILSSTNNTVLDIANDCGFNNLSNFNRLFKQVKKVTPNEYRKRFNK